MTIHALSGSFSGWDTKGWKINSGLLNVTAQLTGHWPPENTTKKKENMHVLYIMCMCISIYIYIYYYYHYYILLLYLYNINISIYIYILIVKTNQNIRFPTFPPWDMPSFSHKNTKKPCCTSASPEFQPRPAWNSWLSSLPPAAPSRCAPPVLWSSLTAAWPTCEGLRAVGDVGSGFLTPVSILGSCNP